MSQDETRTPGHAQPVVQVRLAPRRVAAPSPPAPELNEIAPAAVTMTPPHPPAEAPRTASEPVPTRQAATARLSTSVLRDQVAGLQHTAPPADGPAPLLRLQSEWKAGFTAPLLEAVDTLFSRDFAPVEAEVLDQWTEPGGVRRVVMRLPSGETLCGRAAPWDPLNPLVEPVPMFHLCKRR
ncbi:MAG: hypothetical protein HKN58_06685 [Xanthomonadales bacterium]|nr:hypothetical protein [Xanthomonadales bacterium]